LLGDAQLWDLLGRSCKRQIAEFRTFDESCRSKAWAALLENSAENQVEKDLKLWQEKINELENAYLTGLKSLMETAQDLIQLVCKTSRR
jgi:hypothetical protein